MKTILKKRRPIVHTGLCFDISGDTVTVSGPEPAMRKAFDLPWMNYIEVDGEIQTTIFDPRGYGVMAANMAMQKTRGKWLKSLRVR